MITNFTSIQNEAMYGDFTKLGHIVVFQDAERLKVKSANNFA